VGDLMRELRDAWVDASGKDLLFGEFVAEPSDGGGGTVLGIGISRRCR
jgi:hypothetical protein